jgi:hypothetical protein
MTFSSPPSKREGEAQSFAGIKVEGGGEEDVGVERIARNGSYGFLNKSPHWASAGAAAQKNNPEIPIQRRSMRMFYRLRRCAKLQK